MPKVVTPVLSSSAGYIEDVRDQVMSLVRFVLMNPGYTSSLWEDRIVSFRKLVSEYENDKHVLTSELSSRINTLLSNKFRDCQITTNFIAQDIDPANYRVLFDITMTRVEIDPSEEIPLLVSGQFSVNKDTYDIDIKWSKVPDTLSFVS